ncbi:MAG: TIGR04149 family rSAM-modified RiPP [Tannerellaceae bacterium]
MKKSLSLKLTQLNKAELSKRELNRLLGGNRCCICRGDLNLNANVKGGASGLIPGDGGGGTGAGSFA